MVFNLFEWEYDDEFSFSFNLTEVIRLLHQVVIMIDLYIPVYLLIYLYSYDDSFNLYKYYEKIAIISIKNSNNII